jgi:glycosyltransferase involved in cell wall biosynthesis
LAPRVSVIIPAHDAARYLAEAVASVQRQTLTDWELIIVDDGSRDDTHAIAQSGAATDSRIVVLKQPQAGQVRAMCAGLGAAAPGALGVLCQDSDDVLEQSALQVMSDYLAAQPEAGAVLCQQTWIDEHGRRMPGGRRDRWGKGRLFPRRLPDKEQEIPFLTFYCGSGAGPFTMWRRRTLDVVGLWDPSLVHWNDADLLCRIALHSSVHFLPMELYRYRRHAGQSTRRTAEITQCYEIFRAKWLSWTPQNERERALLSEAHQFYYRVFRPIRDVHVARLALRDFFKTFEMRHLGWAAACLGSAFRKAFEAAPVQHRGL